ncbi:hypothetical protein AOT31_10910 [Corynebacterium ulcerans]|nr:hypothetical protein AOT31_10910 [Corynebacterium ulcerans]
MLIVMVFGFHRGGMAAILGCHALALIVVPLLLEPAINLGDNHTRVGYVGVITLAVLATGASLVGWKPASVTGIALGFLLTATAAAIRQASTCIDSVCSVTCSLVVFTSFLS